MLEIFDLMMRNYWWPGFKIVLNYVMDVMYAKGGEPFQRRRQGINAKSLFQNALG